MVVGISSKKDKINMSEEIKRCDSCKNFYKIQWSHGTCSIAGKDGGYFGAGQEGCGDWEIK